MKKTFTLAIVLAVITLACSLIGQTGEDMASPTPTPAEDGPARLQSERQCGDGVCDGPENSGNCPQDCAADGTVASPTPAPTESDVRPPLDLPAPLYVLSDWYGLPQVWQLATDGNFSPFTDVYHGVQAFDVAPGGQVLYLMSNGELWMTFDDQTGAEHRRLYLSGGAVRIFEVGAGGRIVYVSEEGALWADNLLGILPQWLVERPPDGAEISGLAISPDGVQVAYVVRTPDADCATSGFPEVDGIWVVSTEGGTPHQLARSRCLGGEGGGGSPVAFRSVPIWSPDSTRLLVPTSVSEGTYYGVLDLAEGTLRYPDPPTLLSGSAVWSRDGQAIIGTEGRFLAPDNLLWVDVATLEASPLLDGRALGTVAVEPRQLADGRIAFWMAKFDADDPAGLTYDLYLGTLSEDAFSFERAVATELPQPWNAVWSNDGSVAAMEVRQEVNGGKVTDVALVSVTGQVMILEASWSPKWGPSASAR